jgi:uncharacterized protein (TIGR04255 family)
VSPGDYPTLSRPPLREALIEIQLSELLPPAFNQKLQIQNLGGFARTGDIRQGGMKFQVSHDKPAHAMIIADEVLGARFDTEDKSQVVQLRRNGMTFSILRNYKDWDHIRDTARELWQRFLILAALPAVQVNRVAVRYINAIEVPLGANFDDYLTAAPRVPSELPQLLSSFFQRIQVPFGGNSIAIITHALEAPSLVVLDIDVINQEKMDGAGPAVWNKMEELRSIKNKIFFASITKRTLEACL